MLNDLLNLQSDLNPHTDHPMNPGLCDAQTPASERSEGPDVIDEKPTTGTEFSRRTFVQVLGAGILIAATGTEAIAQVAGGRGGGRGGGAQIQLDARIHIAKDGTITVMSGKVEGGQGARAELTQAAAEELRLPVEKINLILGDTALTPNDGGTFGSGTTPNTVPAVRRACAMARKLLDDFASKSPAGKEITFADLASADDFVQSSKQTIPRDVQVTAVKDWKTMGTPVARPNARDLVTGGHKYPSDQIRPGMLYGKMLRAPAFGATLKSIDLAPAKAMEGVFAVREDQYVGVAAPTTYLAKKALRAIEATAQWDIPPHPSSKTLADYFRKNASQPIPSNPFADALSGAAKTLKATYEIPYVQHSPLEPRAAVAEWQDGNVTVWTGTQNPPGVRGEMVNALQVGQENVRVIVPDFGGGFGGKHNGDAAIEAAWLSRAAGKPVAVRWTRTEEFTWACFRNAAVIDLHATLDEKNALSSWFQLDFNYGTASIECPYVTREKARTQVVRTVAPLREASYRALAASCNNFARESFVDELADAAGKNPLEFRLANMGSNQARLRAVLEEAAKHFDFTTRFAKKDQKDIGVGLACGIDKGSFVAACAEVEVDRAKGTVKVRHVCEVFDCGAVVNPTNLTSQIQGAIMQGMGPALREISNFENGKITNASFFTYEVPRFADLPELDIHLLNRPDQPSVGAGETPIIAIAPAIANAVFHATGIRVRQMPIKLPATA